jgi:membrane protein implicated in regulation of membrane protease activity
LGYEQRYVGEVVTVADEVAPGARGRAQYRGSDWNIQNVGESAIAAGGGAKVVEVDGLTLKVVAE